MGFSLDPQQVANLLQYVDSQVQTGGCDHTHRFSETWATVHSIQWDDLLDALESHGAFCDCEVVLNVDSDCPLTDDQKQPIVQSQNRWQLPGDLIAGQASTTSKIIVSRAGVAKNTYTREGEWLVPAPLDAKPRKRVRKMVHFFIGVESGMPSEIGFICDVKPQTAAEFVETIARSNVPELRGFDEQVASFVFRKISPLPAGTVVGTDIVERVGIASKRSELSIHRIILRP
jgi:hypothetical protein